MTPRTYNLSSLKEEEEEERLSVSNRERKTQRRARRTKGLRRDEEKNRTKSTRDWYHAKRVLAPVTPHRAKNTSNVAFDAFETQFTRRNPAHSLQKCILKRAQFSSAFIRRKREKREREFSPATKSKNSATARAKSLSQTRVLSLSLYARIQNIRVKLFVPARLSAFFRHFSLRV